MKTRGIINDAEGLHSLPSSDEEEEESCLDDDIVSAYELEKNFQVKYKVADESAVTLKKDYILSLCRDSSFTRLAAGLSNASVQIFDISEQRGLTNVALDFLNNLSSSSDSSNNICGVRFLDETPNSLLIGTTNGIVGLYDLRTPRDQTCFENSVNENGAPKNISCFDCNANGRILCTGSEQYQNNVFLLFYDVRARKQLGGYFDSHQDDVTAVQFHSENPDLLCTGSTDGLINIFDIKEPDEDDALLSTINTESSVHKLSWHKNVYEKDLISCITHTNDFKIYECEEGDLVAEFKRSLITDSAKRKNPANCNLIDAHNLEDGNIFLLAGTNNKKGEIMRSLRFQSKQLVPLADFDGNKQIVRESIFEAKSNCIVTAGESGIVTVWTPQNSEPASGAGSSYNKLKTKTKLKSNKKTPY